jgi:hypothetical protein
MLVSPAKTYHHYYIHSISSSEHALRVVLNRALFTGISHYGWKPEPFDTASLDEDCESGSGSCGSQQRRVLAVTENSSAGSRSGRRSSRRSRRGGGAGGRSSGSSGSSGHGRSLGHGRGDGAAESGVGCGLVGRSSGGSSSSAGARANDGAGQVSHTATGTDLLGCLEGSCSTRRITVSNWTTWWRLEDVLSCSVLVHLSATQQAMLLRKVSLLQMQATSMPQF